MRLKFNNIGIIKEADILIDGLTVLAGQNDTGKSTVGKLLYSLIKVSNNYKKVLRMNQRDSLINIIDELANEVKEINSIKLVIPQDVGKNNINSYSASSVDFFDQDEMNRRRIKEVIINNDNDMSKFIEMVKGYIKKIGIFEPNLNVDKYYSKVSKIKILDDNSFEVKSAAIDLMIEDEFKNQISNTEIKELSMIKLLDKEFTIIDLLLNDNTVADINALKSSSFTDITYIDTPFQLQDYSISELMKIQSGRKFLKKHSIDLIEKLYSKYIDDNKDTENIINEIEKKEKAEKFENIIKQVIGGDFEYSHKIRNFVYRRNGDEYRLVNTATGIRAFAMLKILLNSGHLVKDSVLIIDEPEVHLHPQWQMDYAELLVRMVKELEIKVVINSHSPYMIEAFKVYSDHYGISGITNFYNMQREGNFTEVIWANNSLGEIFDELSIPFSKLDKLRIADFDK